MAQLVKPWLSVILTPGLSSHWRVIRQGPCCGSEFECFHQITNLGGSCQSKLSLNAFEYVNTPATRQANMLYSLKMSTSNHQHDHEPPRDSTCVCVLVFPLRIPCHCRSYSYYDNLCRWIGWQHVPGQSTGYNMCPAHRGYKDASVVNKT